jgi:hypothetical protein
VSTPQCSASFILMQKNLFFHTGSLHQVHLKKNQLPRNQKLLNHCGSQIV